MLDYWNGPMKIAEAVSGSGSFFADFLAVGDEVSQNGRTGVLLTGAGGERWKSFERNNTGNTNHVGLDGNGNADPCSVWSRGA
ncbi:hypothetical protein C0J52_14779 [Blattella germanica]|nr:hypothetical protein C0J52_14779 [Blattella germanica]